jgi:hypothetical protein
MSKQTAAVIVKFTLNSASPSPFFINKVAGEIEFSDGSSRLFSGFDPLDVGAPQSGGAAFYVLVHDENSTGPATGVENWAVTFLPRSGTSDPSPVSPQNDIVGNGASSVMGDFVLGLPPSVKIKPRKTAGSWDWSLMVQMVLPGGDTHCFVSDPEMDVDPLALSQAERDALFALASKKKGAAASTNPRRAGKGAKAPASKKKKLSKRR